LQRQHPEALFVSARTGEGLEALRALLRTGAAARSVHVELELVRDAPRILSFCYREGRVLAQDQTDAGRPRLRVRFAPAAYRRLQQVHGDDFLVVDGHAAKRADA
jgi:GTP-binding protein HflX